MDSEGQDGSVPHDLQVAILDLLEACKEKDISIPDRLGSEFLDVLSPPRKEVAADIITFSERLMEDKEAHKKAISDSPIVIEAFEIQKKLKRKRFRANIYVKDGSFKYIEHIDPTEAERSAESKIETVYYGGRVQGLLQRLLRTLRGDFSGKEAVEHFPVKKINLFFEQGKTYLVLGAPMSGKSSLLKLIAGILPEDKDHAVGGSVNVNKITPKSKGIVWSNVVGYIDQIDRLHPYLTVEETCHFAFKCRTGGTHRTPTDDPGPEAAAAVEEMDATQYLVTSVLEAMDLTNVKNTFVGDQQNVRGVSGGEKKRVTVSEMCVGRFPILCMDEISTGLDAATTYGICKLMGEVNALIEGIRIVTLLQPPPETFALFDDLIVLSEGQVIYSGPVEEVVPYFESLGYRLPERMDAADWLQALPTKDGAQFLDVTIEDGNIERPKRHLSSDEFHSKFYESEFGQKILETLHVPIEVHKRNSELFALQEVRELYTKRFRNSSMQSLKLLIAREFLLWWRDKPVIRARIIQDLLMGVIAGTVFWQGWDDVSSVLGILFQSMLFVALGAMTKVAPQFAVRGVLYKHQDANFFPTWTYVVGRSLATIPASAIDGLVYGTIVYWSVGLAHSDGASFGNFIIFVLIIMFSSTGIGLLLSVFSAITKDRSVGQAAMSVLLVLLILFSGFTVTPNNIPDYWIWLYWMNILAWAFRGLIINEYDSGKYDEVTDIEYLGKNFTIGQLIIKNGGFVDSNGEPYTFEWAAYSILFSAVVCILGVIASSVALVKVRFPTGKSLSNGSLDESDDKEKEVNAVETVLPFQKANLTFKDVRYTIVSSVGNEKIELLKGIDGLIEGGKMTALMGSSGAGKTTLMDVLSLRKSSGEITGEVRLNGHLQEEQSFRRCTGYVEQFDVQTAQLTIRETCEFSAKLRLESTDAAVTPRSRELFIDQTLDMLELTPIQHYLVGSDAGGGLSFEQKKRLSIAVELVANPSILFLDEPTSGLDARAAAIVMRGLKRIALSGRAVCATIHQPSIAIFNSFDSLLLLKRGGEVVFHGELGNESSNLIQYLQSYENTPLIQPGENPATWMLTTIGSGNAKSGNPFDYAGAYTNSQLHTKCLESISRIKNEALNDSLITFPHMYATTTKTQLIEVMKRTWTVYWRSPSYNRTRIIVAALLSLLIGSVFVSNQVPTDDTQMRSRMTTVYLSFLIVAVNGMNTVLSFFEAERNMFYRHKSALMYNTFSVSTAFTLAEIPFLVGTSFLYTTIFYFMVGFATDVEKFGYYYLFMLLCMSLFTYTGQMLIALCRNAQIAQGFCALVGSNTGLFSGVLIQPLNIPKFWIFMYWLLPGHYVLEGLLTTQYDNDTTPIAANPGSKFYQYLVDSDQCAQGSKVCIGTAEEWVSSTFDGEFSRENVPYDILYLVGVTVLTRVISVWALAYLNYRVT
mmetsp:Transcript_17034/g.39117  ORF Transcript_17034/g.39117 Transcript_17034/m.39117 type:complete len:1432 (-) Transcript_17034:3850-8145(-)|eukprot:CAMPEP_0172403322 /NCGR_PEP_ID=MMETSP1061-20121228/58733_1 /TAXON_ID=37318 /ORGANISM="Pseudo-nitzschia pungens, Strain cf. pungens" /LENGTH=1431 /DNA_ID=CAMNT_0013137675 /DNA_START=155 /DNA_END=4450 /DNA_ORIENTATION=+